MTSNLMTLVPDCECRVSSVLDRNTKELGKQHLFDGRSDTCWNSHQGLPQWVVLRWSKEPVIVEKVIAQFQGGFCGGADTVLEGSTTLEDDLEPVATWHLQDVGTEQTLELPAPTSLAKIKLHFKTSTDFYGRIIMYKLDVLGKKREER
ncbi:nuclear receptor 2C2-associated protein [Oratosquilla oratoria]|uniref:nuclear receptor 2C2-associated protein n=1 Tax=Oratosquilla oratoria TaxID=337810 RepID=UPI003F76AD33